MDVEFKTVILMNRVHVVKEQCDRTPEIPKANWQGLGVALCGVLEKGQSLKKWIALYGKLYSTNK